MKTDYLDDAYWLRLANKYSVRLPHKTTALTTGTIETWLKKLGLTGTDWKEWTGGMTMKAFVTKNAEWSMRGVVGLLLELKDKEVLLSGEG